MRASLLASAIANMLRCSRFEACSTQGHKPRIAALGRRSRTTCAACTNSVLRYLLPRLEILPRIVRSPVDSCFGTSPQPSAKVAALLESGAVADRRHHGARDDRSDARHRHQALTTVVLLRQRFDFGRPGCNALVKPTPVLGQVSDEANHSVRKRASV